MNTCDHQTLLWKYVVAKPSLEIDGGITPDQVARMIEHIIDKGFNKSLEVTWRKSMQEAMLYGIGWNRLGVDNFITNKSSTDLMLDSDLHTDGHDIHFHDCLDCGKSFQFRDEDQFQCAPCELRELEDHRRERIEDVLLGANKVIK